MNGSLKTRVAILALSGIFTVAATSAASAALLNDTFDVPAAGGASRADDASDANDTAWYLSNLASAPTANAVVVNDAGAGKINTGYALAMAGSNASPLVGNFQTVSLASEGQYVRLKFDWRLVGSLATERQLRFGLFDSNPDAAANSVVDADNQASRTANDAGYWSSLVAQTTTSDYASLVRKVGGVNILSGGSGNTSLASNGSVAKYGNDPHNVTLEVSREAENVRVKLIIDGNTLLNYLDPIASARVTFNEIGFTQVGTGQDSYFDNIMIETNIPEPAGLGLLGLAGTAMLGYRRR